MASGSFCWLFLLMLCCYLCVYPLFVLFGLAGTLDSLLVSCCMVILMLSAFNLNLFG